MERSIAYVGFSDDKYVEVVTGSKDDLEDIINPKGFLMKEVIKPERDAYKNVYVFYYNCEQYDLWLNVASSNPTAYSSFYENGTNDLSFRNLQGKIDSFLDRLRNNEHFLNEEVMRTSN